MIFGADLLRIFFSVGGAIASLLVAAGWLRLRNTRAARRFLYTVAAFYAVVSLLCVPTAAGKVLSHGYHPFLASDVRAGSRVAIVVLGTGSVTVGDWWGDNYSTVDRGAAQRVLEAVHVYRQIHAEYVISSGGDPHPSPRRTPSGDTMRESLVALGVPAERIRVETRSRTTRDEAVIVAAMLRNLPVDTIVLVTSESHMRRALGAFRAVGIQCVPAIAVEFDFGADWPAEVVPTREGLDSSSVIAHEIAGFAYYFARGWWVR